MFPFDDVIMETFSALLIFCEGNSPVAGEFPSQRPVTRSFGVFFDVRPNKRLSKPWRRQWFETTSHSLWRHRNVSGFSLQYHKLISHLKESKYDIMKFCTDTFECCEYKIVDYSSWSDTFQYVLNYKCMIISQDKSWNVYILVNVYGSTHDIMLPIVWHQIKYSKCIKLSLV